MGNKEKDIETVEVSNVGEKMTAYSRSENRSYHTDKSRSLETNQDQFFKIPVTSKHRLSLFLFSVLISLLSIGLPLLLGLTNLVQEEYLYTGLMLTKGLLPYGDIFATGGFLYYILVSMAYLLGSKFWLIVPYTLAFYVMGVYFYRLVGYFTRKEDWAMAATLLFYLLNASLGFGGLYPVQLALPFVLIGLWFIAKYLAQAAIDESFVLYGFLGALSILIDPKTIIFWLLSSLMVLAVSLSRREKARGFYQLLCLFFGSILVFYTASYFLINLQVLSNYFSQALLYRLSTFSQGREQLWLALGVQLILALGAGLLTGLFLFVKKSEDTYGLRGLQRFILLIFGLNLVHALLSQSFEPYLLVDSLPYGLLLTVSYLSYRADDEKVITSHRQKKQGRLNDRVFTDLLKSLYYLPMLVMIASVGYVSWQSVNQNSLVKDRQLVTNYLKKNATADEKIYVWDNSTTIYEKTFLTSSSVFILPDQNTASVTNRRLLEDDLLQNQASYLIVNKRVPLSQTVSDHLQKNYKPVAIKNLKQFMVYNFE